ncbi:MAG TPA: hypothetical protein VFL45_10410 [Gammaproteobacteria bacterium]|jgi:hypothetical protein|nr:hypothetical protein [Gammaproteobacteria bacterium]
MRNWIRASLAAGSILILTGCASYVGSLRHMNQALAAHDPVAALAALEPLADGRDQALYLLDKAMILRMRGDYAGSIRAFEQTKPLLHFLEATSVTETAAALTLSENLRSYTPPLYERLLLHVYQTLNYLQSGDAEAARVEARQIDVLLRRLYPATDAAPGGVDAFARYFAGLIYEDAGAWSDAMIAYRKAYEAYTAANRPLPPDLAVSLCRFADYLGLDKELATWRQRFGINEWPPVVPRAQAPEGQLVFLLSDGLAPKKIAVTQMVQDPRHGRFYSISLPALHRRPSVATTATVTIGGKSTTTGTVEDVAARARAELDANRAGLVAAEIARNVARGAVAHKADDKQQGLGALVSLIGAVIDRADTRLWNTLPDNIQTARLRLAPGQYDMTVSLRDGAGRIVETKLFEDVTIEPGRITFATWHAIGY